MNLSFPSAFGSSRRWWHRDAGVVFNTLQRIALTGDYSRRQLDEFLVSGVAGDCREFRYLLTSLYLQLGQTDIADTLLSGHRAGAEMTRYFSVLLYCVQNSLPSPRLSHKQVSALKNISDRLRGQQALVNRIEQLGGFSVVGNAPAGELLSTSDNLCTFYFNDYRQNPAVNGVASVHVVSPSWKRFSVIESDAILLSGNSIFHRRSRVWERFAQVGCINSIYTAPRELWSKLHTMLESSPTAGLLVLSWLGAKLRSGELDAKRVQGHVAGFSLKKPMINHVFNNERVSPRHNWTLEPQLVEQALYRLRHRIDGFQCPDLVETI